MSTQRVAKLGIINSVSTLSKVCSSRQSIECLRSLNFDKNLSTAAEWAGSQSPTGVQAENSPEFQQNPNGFDGQTHQNPNGFNGQTHQNPCRPSMPYEEVTEGAYRQSLSPSIPNGNCEGYPPRNGFQQNLGGQNGSFNRHYTPNSGGFQGGGNVGYAGSSVGFKQSSNGIDQNHMSAFQNVAGFQQNLGGQNGSFNRHYTPNSGGFTGGVNVGYDGSSVGFEQSSNGIDRNHMSAFQNLAGKNGNSSGYYGQCSEQLNGSTNRTYTEGLGSGVFDQRPTGLYPNSQNELQSNSVMQNQYQNYYGHHSVGSRNSEESPTGYYPCAGTKFQPTTVAQNGNSGGSYGHMSSASQQNTSNEISGAFGGNPNGNYRQPIGHYPQSRNVSLNNYPGQFQQSLNEYQNRDFGSQPASESIQTAKTDQFRGTCMELDDCCKQGKLKEAVQVLGLLEKQRIPVDITQYLQLIRACGEAKALEEGKHIHDHLFRLACPLKVSTYNEILEMYSLCGSMDDALLLFKTMPERDLTTWNTMITGYAINGLGEDAIDLFNQFQKVGLKPDGKTFLGVFSACSILNDIDEGMFQFDSMSKSHGILPTMEHYVSIVNMFGCIGHLDEAFDFIEKMPLEPGIEIWETLMNLCRIHGNIELGDRCAELVEQTDPSRLNEEAKAGLVPMKASDLEKEKAMKKQATQNALEGRNKVRHYRAGDKSGPDNDKLYALLRGLREQMKEAGYVAETRFVLHDIDQESKEDALLAHSERLAVAHGLLTSSARSDLVVIKNLRVCGDCHNAMKIISKIVGRKLVMRDAKRFHHVENGLCSCRDYW